MTDDVSSDSSDDKPILIRPVKIGIFARLRNWFLTGIIVTAPIGLTVYLTYAFVDFVDRNVASLLPEPYHPRQVLPFSVPGLGLLIAIGGLTVVGFVTANFAGHALIRLGERMVDRMPVVRSVYGALKQIFETVLAQSSTSFRQVVLVEFPRAGAWTVAFVTAEWRGEIARKLDDDIIGVYVPTTPNPTSGYLVYVPRRDVIMLSMSVEEATKLVISGGVLQIPDRNANPNRAERTPKKGRAPEPQAITPSADT